MAMEHHLAIESFSYSWLVNLKPNSFSFDYCPCRSSEEDNPLYPFDHDQNDLYCYYYDEQDEECFIEMDPKKRRRDLKKTSSTPSTETQDFNFHHVSADTLVDADQIFADGLLVPLHHLIAAATTCSSTSTRMQKGEEAVSSMEYYCCSPSFSEPTPAHEPLSSSNSTISSAPPSAAFLARCRRYSKRILLRCVGCLRSWLQMRRRRRRTGPVISGMASPPQATTTSPPRMSTSSSSSSSSLSSSSSSSRSSSSSTQWCEKNIMLGMASDVERSISEAVLHCKRSNGESGL